MNETAWRADVIRAARTFGWVEWFTHYSPYSTPGWPDLALARPPRLILTELKTDSTRSKLSPDQETARDLLERCETVEYHLWRPADLDTIIATLRRPGDPAQMKLGGL